MSDLRDLGHLPDKYAYLFGVREATKSSPKFLFISVLGTLYSMKNKKI